MCFIDLQKAYDSVNREALWHVCCSYGLTDKMIRMLKLLYNHTTAQVLVDDKLTASFLLQTGVRQGCLLSCLLFNLLMDFVIRRVLDETESVKGVQLIYRIGDIWHTGISKKGGTTKFEILHLL